MNTLLPIMLSKGCTKSLMVCFAVVFLLLPILSNAQNKGDNAIFIKDSIAANKIINVFVTAGYGLDKQNDGYISTMPTDKKGMAMKFAILKQDSSYLLQGWFNSNQELTLYGVTAKSEWSRISKLGKIYRQEMWDELVMLARKLSSKIEYVRL